MAAATLTFSVIGTLSIKAALSRLMSSEPPHCSVKVLRVCTSTTPAISRP